MADEQLPPPPPLLPHGGGPGYSQRARGSEQERGGRRVRSRPGRRAELGRRCAPSAAPAAATAAARAAPRWAEWAGKGAPNGRPGGVIDVAPRQSHCAAAGPRRSRGCPLRCILSGVPGERVRGPAAVGRPGEGAAVGRFIEGLVEASLCPPGFVCGAEGGGGRLGYVTGLTGLGVRVGAAVRAAVPGTGCQGPHL